MVPYRTRQENGIETGQTHTLFLREAFVSLHDKHDSNTTELLPNRPTRNHKTNKTTMIATRQGPKQGRQGSGKTPNKPTQDRPSFLPKRNNNSKFLFYRSKERTIRIGNYKHVWRI